MSDLETAINAVWAEHHVERTGADMTNECRLAASILSLRAKLATWEAVPGRIQALLATRTNDALDRALTISEVWLAQSTMPAAQVPTKPHNAHYWGHEP
jgi:hypothetical protein